MAKCCVPNCCSRSCQKGYIDVDGSKISFHLFPLDEIRKKDWLLAIKRQGNKANELWSPKKRNATVCSRHFTQKDFTLGFKRKFLLDTAIPSVFTKDLRSKKERMKLTPKKLSKKANPSKKSRLTSDKIIEQASTEMNQVSSPSIPRVMAVWSCSNNKTDNNLAVINEEINNLPLYMKQALMAKAAIDKTYEDTSDVVASNSEKNVNLFPHPIVNNTVFIPSTENGHKNTTNLSCTVPTNSVANPIVNNTVLIPATENGPKNITNLSYIVPTHILTSTVTEKVCDASTSTDFQDIVPKLNTQLERAKERNERQAKVIKPTSNNLEDVNKV